MGSIEIDLGNLSGRWEEREIETIPDGGILNKTVREAMRRKNRVERYPSTEGNFAIRALRRVFPFIDPITDKSKEFRRSSDGYPLVYGVTTRESGSVVKTLETMVAVRSAEGVRYAFSEIDHPLFRPSETPEGNVFVGNYRHGVQINAVNQFTQEEINSALDESKYNARLGTQDIYFPESGETMTVAISAFTTRDVAVHKALVDPTALNFVETDDGLQPAPRLYEN